jgi:putative FmdB family regulatory protein
MPTYEYQCSACQHEFERDQRISEAPVKKCPKCGKQKAKRLISRTSFVLKGGGWYGDLYGSVKPASESKPEASKGAIAPAGAEASASKTETKSDGAAKPEAKTEKKTEKKKSSKGKAAA